MSVACVAASGCGGAVATGAGPLGSPREAASDQLYAGDAVGPPSVQGLPESDVPRAELSEQMKRAWLLAEESLAVDPPEPPLAAVSVQQWSETTLRQWMEHKSQRFMAAREALNEAANESERERILAGAILGLVYEDVGRVLVSLPEPPELENEPEIAAMYREVMRGQAAPFLRHSRTAYDACAANAKHRPSLSHWGRYCHHRREVLPGARIEPVDGTVVVVERE